MQRARAGEATLAQHRGGQGQGEADAAATSVEDVVRWGTAGGARVLGLAAVGTLAPGMAADIAIYSLAQHPRYFGLHDVAIGPVACGGSAHLKSLLIGARAVVRDGAVAGLDLAALRRQAQDAVAEIIARAG